LEVILDTGSADLWVLQAAYDHKQSSTYAANGGDFEIRYADGDAVAGFLSEDSLGFGNGLKVPHQVFAEIDDGGEGFGQSCRESGILGLGMDERSHARSKSPFHALVATGALERAMFSMLLVDDQGGLLTLGGANPEHFSGSLQWFPVLGTMGDDDFDDDYDDAALDDAWLDDEMVGGKLKKWLIPLDHVEVEMTKQEGGGWGGGGRVIRGGATSVLIDTGATLMSAPKEAFAMVADDLGAQCWFQEAEFIGDDGGDDDRSYGSANDDDNGYSDRRHLLQLNKRTQDNPKLSTRWPKRELESSGDFIGGPCAMALDGGDDEFRDGGGATYKLSFALVPCHATPSLTFSFGDERYRGDDMAGLNEEEEEDPLLVGDGRFTLDGKELVRPPPEPCAAGEFMDCFGGCFEEEAARSWVGDGMCDGGGQGFSFNCPAFGCDGGDCGEDCEENGDPGETCELGKSKNAAPPLE
jgi:hypothetical protein